MREIDARYEQGEETEVDELEALLEETLESLEAALCALAEDDDRNEELEPDVDAEPDPGEGCSIEEQLVAAYERHLLSPHLFPFESLVACLNDVLISAQRGGMTPSGFRGAEPDTLVALAAELQLEYRARLAAVASQWRPARSGTSRSRIASRT